MIESRSSLTGRRAAREILRLGLAASLSAGNMQRLARVMAGTVDWDYLLYLAEYHSVAPLFAGNLTQNILADQVPGQYLKRLSRIYTENIPKNVLLSAELVKILALFSRNGIEVITLKGTILGEQLYGNPGLRTTYDIDILVQPEKLPRAGILLREMDYSESTLPQEREHPFHRVYQKNTKIPFTVELHWNLGDPEVYAINLEEIWLRARNYQFQGGTTIVLSPEDNILYLATNLMTQDGQQLRYLSDITGLIRNNQDSLDWDYIIKCGHSRGTNAAIYYALMWAQELLEAPVPKPVIKALRPSLPRRCFISWLVSPKTLLSPASWIRLRGEIAILAHSLMMSRTRQTLNILARYRGYNKKGVWLRNIAWIPLVFGIALWLNVIKFLSR